MRHFLPTFLSLIFSIPALASDLSTWENSSAQSSDPVGFTLSELLYSDQSYEVSGHLIPLYRLDQSLSCEDVKKIKSTMLSNQTLCAGGYLNLCELDDLELYLSSYSHLIVDIPTDPNTKFGWELSDLGALKSMNSCNAGDAKACIEVSEYTSRSSGNDSKISGCAPQGFDQFDQRQIKRANWLLKGAMTGDTEALQNFIAATDGCSGLLEYGTENNCQNGRLAQIEILKTLQTVKQSDGKFSSILQNGLGEAYAYTAQYQKSFISHKKACELHNAKSCFQLGHQSSHGYGFLPKNHLRAIQYFEKAKSLGLRKDDVQVEQFFIYTNPDSPLFDLEKAKTVIKPCSESSEYCRRKWLSIVAFSGEPMMNWKKFDDIILDHEDKYDYVNQRLVAFPILGPHDFSDNFYQSNSFWFRVASYNYLSAMLKNCYARNPNACLLISYVFSEKIWDDTGLGHVTSPTSQRLSVTNLLPKPNYKISYKYLLMTELSELPDVYKDKYFHLERTLENKLSNEEKISVQNSASSAKLWAFEN